MDKLPQPKGLNFKSTNLADAWDKWISRFKNYATAVELKKKSKDVQVAIFLEVLGDGALDIFNTFNFKPASGEGETAIPAESREDLDTVIKKFEHYCKPRKGNTVFERYRFWARAHQQDEPVDAWVVELRALAANCQFGDQLDLMIRDKIVFHTNDKQAQVRMLREAELPLERALDICHASEATKKQLEDMGEDKKSVHAVRHRHRERSRASTGSRKDSKDRNEKQARKKCKSCGHSHPKYKCRAYGKSCHICSEKHHFAGTPACKGKKKGAQVDAIDTSDSDSDSSSECESSDDLVIGNIVIGKIDTSMNKKSKWQEDMLVEGDMIRFQLDTGAEANILPKAYVKDSMKKRIKPTTTKLFSYGGTKIPAEGCLTLKVTHPRKKKGVKIRFYVVHTKTKPILGNEACEHFDLIKRIHKMQVDEDIFQTYSDVFKGLGKYEGQYRIELKDGVQPVSQPPRRIPHAKRDKLRETLRELEQRGIIAPVNKSTEWCSNLVIAEKKSGKMRICLDPRQLNEAVKRNNFTAPTAEEVMSQLAGKSIFTVIDMKDGYYHIELDDYSSHLCTFSTPWGRMRFCRLPFGVRCASDEMQRLNQQTFEHIPGTYVIADDIIVAGKDEKEHDLLLKKVLDRAREKNIRFNPEKVQYKVEEVIYMGNKITSEGIKPDPAKVEAIKNMPEPTDKTAVQRVLGMVKYLDKYIPHASEICKPLRDLLKKENKWSWQNEHREAMKQVKAALMSDEALQFYNVKDEVTIQADASQHGLGATLLQGGKPVCYASRALSECESRYAQIEKELLAVCFGCQKFHQYIFGKPVTVQSDHKPLEAIFKKQLGAVPPRLQRMMLRLQPYDVNIKYTRGKNMYVADTLSRAHLSVTEEEMNKDIHTDNQIMVHMLYKAIPVAEDLKEEIKRYDDDDEEMQILCDTIMNGWPQHKMSSPKTLQDFWAVKNELHIAEGAVCAGERIVIPRKLRREVLAKLHKSHFGMEKTKARAKQAVYWPNMEKDIEKMITECETCLAYRPNQCKEPMKPHPIPSRPWEIVGSDILTRKGEDFLLVIDYLSKYPEVFKLKDKTAEGVIEGLKEIMSRHGIPETMIADNMPFNSAAMRQFANSINMEIITSSPTYAQSNGEAERHVQNIKNMMKKSRDNFWIALLEYRTAPITGTPFAPSQILMSRKLRSIVPSTAHALMPRVVDPTIHLQQQKAKQKRYYDRGSKEMADLAPGEVVRIKRGDRWEPAQVTELAKQPRSYWVEHQGHELRRNRRHLLKTGEALCNTTPQPPQEEVEPKSTQDQPPPTPYPEPARLSCESGTQPIQA
jgi:hypothetical protein